MKHASIKENMRGLLESLFVQYAQAAVKTPKANNPETPKYSPQFFEPG